MKPTPNALFISAARGLAEVGSRYGEYKLYFMERSGAWKINWDNRNMKSEGTQTFELQIDPFSREK